MSSYTTIAEKVSGGERLSFDEGVELYRSNDIVALGRLANHRRERLNGNLTYYNVNRHINYTNVCVIDCQLCQGAYARKPGEDGGYTMQLAEVFRFAAHCEENKCRHFDGSHCQLATRIVQILPAVTDGLPPCLIRAECRWFQQEGKAACMRCPQVVTESYEPDEDFKRAALGQAIP